MKTAIGSLVLLTLFLIGIPPAVAQPVVLEDFATMRYNGMPTPLWQGMSNQGPTACSVSNNTLVCTTQGSAANGLGFWTMTLACDSTTCYNNVGSYIKSYIKKGTWNPNINRLRFTYKCSTNIAASSNGNHWLEFGTYVRATNEPNPPNSGQGQHFYHFLNQPSRANEWVNVEFNRMVSHRVGNFGDASYPEDPEWNASTLTYPVHYYDGLTHFYWGPTYSSELQAAGVSCTMGAFTMDTVANGADAYVYSIAGSYNPSTGRYDLSWNQPKGIPGGVKFDVRYSDSSMRANGWSTGTNAGSVTGQDDSPYSSVNFSSPAMAKAAVKYFAIRPNMRIKSMSRTSPAEITLTNEPFLSDGDQVTIAGVQTTSGSSHPMNGTYTIRNVNRTTLALLNTSGSAWPDMAANTGTVTATSETKNFAEFVVGTPSSTPAPISPCDINSDGVVNVTDNSLGVQAAVGAASCVADLDGNGRCDVVDSQRVINASLGQTCRVGL